MRILAAVVTFFALTSSLVVDGAAANVLGIVIGYFVGDVIIGFQHFMIDNFKPFDSGYKHHEDVSHEGFRAPMDVACAPTLCKPSCTPCVPCTPCQPCQPSSDKALLSSKEEKIHYGWGWVLPLLPVAIFLGKYGVFVSMMALIVILMNTISGSGAADYYAHYPEKAPMWVTALQRLGLLMNAEDHEYHHTNPDKHYCYFSRITNAVLDTLNFWAMMRSVCQSLGYKLHLAPAMKVVE